MTEITQELFSVVMDGGYQILQQLVYRRRLSLKDKAHKLLDYILIGALLFFSFTVGWNDHFPCSKSKKALSLNDVRLQGSEVKDIVYFLPL